MLPPDARVTLTDQLRPPAGWQLDHAVATTFTLDLAAALSVPLAFAAHRLAEVPDPLEVMEAVRACTDRVDVFCQAGHISAPAVASELFAFLEPMVHQVRQPRPGRLFHPKLWFLRYVDEDGDTAYRLLVLSRNLTGDRGWDVCLRLDGTLGTRRDRRNAPLTALLRWLTADDRCVGGLARDRAERITELADDVDRVEWEYPNDVRDLAFHVLGIDRRLRPKFDGTRHLVVSAFVNEAGLRTVAPLGSRSVHVVSRQEELDRLPETETDRVTAHVLDVMAGLDDDTDGSHLLSGLHAKLYVVEYDHEARLLVGSANATDAAFGGNVEVLVELSGSKHRFGIKSMMDAEAPFAEILVPYSRSAQSLPEDDPTLAAVLRAIADIPLVARAAPDGAHFRLTVKGDWPLPQIEAKVTIAPLTRPGHAMTLRGETDLDVTFAGLGLTEITPFFTVHATGPDGEQRSAVVVATLLDDPEDRLDTILAAQIDSPEKFLRFVALLLGLIGGIGTADGEAVGNTGQWYTGAGSGVFELLVRALVDQPGSLDTLGRLVERMRRTEAGRNNLPEGFEQLWAEVVRARARLAAG